MCAIKITPSPVTQIKGAAYCKSQANDLEDEIVKARFCRFSEFNPLLSRHINTVNQLMEHNKDSLDLSAQKHRLEKLQSHLEKRSLERLNKTVLEYYDYVVQQDPEAISLTYETMCTRINRLVGITNAFYWKVFPKHLDTRISLVNCLTLARYAIDVHFQGGYCGIPFKAIAPPIDLNPPRFLNYASEATLAIATGYFLSELKDLIDQIKSDGDCRYIRYRFLVQQLSEKIGEVASKGNERLASAIENMQKRMHEINSLLQARCMKSLQDRIEELCKTVFTLPVKQLELDRGKIQRRLRQHRLEIIHISEFDSLGKTISQLNQRLLRVKAAIDPDAVFLQTEKARAYPPCFVFILVPSSSSSSSASVSTPPPSPSSSSSPSTSPIPDVLDPEETVKGSELILQEIERLQSVLLLVNQKHIDQGVKELQALQTNIYFELSDVRLTIGQRVLFHFVRSSYVSSDRVRRAIVRTLVELIIAGFIEKVKEKGRNAAEITFHDQLRSLDLWKDYCRFVSQKVDGGWSKNVNDQRAYRAIDEIYAMLKKAWRLS